MAELSHGLHGEVRVRIAVEDSKILADRLEHDRQTIVSHFVAAGDVELFEVLAFRQRLTDAVIHQLAAGEVDLHERGLVLPDHRRNVHEAGHPIQGKILKFFALERIQTKLTDAVAAVNS